MCKLFFLFYAWNHYNNTPMFWAASCGTHIVFLHAVPPEMVHRGKTCEILCYRCHKAAEVLDPFLIHISDNVWYPYLYLCVCIPLDIFQDPIQWLDNEPIGKIDVLLWLHHHLGYTTTPDPFNSKILKMSGRRDGCKVFSFDCFSRHTLSTQNLPWVCHIRLLS